MLFEIFIAFLAGIAAGTLGGLLGLGGGIIIMPYLRFVLGLSPMTAAGTCVAAVFFTTLGGTIKHRQLGHIDFKSIAPIIVAGAVSTVIFSLIFLNFRKQEWWLDLGIGLIFALVAARMIREGLSEKSKVEAGELSTNELRGSGVKKIITGGIAGIFPGLMGIGTGTILVPAFSFFFAAPLKVAMGSSLACFAVNALISSIQKFSQGYMALGIALPISLGALCGSFLGARLNHHIPPRNLRIIFGIVFFYIGLKFILSFSNH